MFREDNFSDFDAPEHDRFSPGKIAVLLLSLFCFAMVVFLPLRMLGITSFAEPTSDVDSGYESDGKTSDEILSDIESLYKELNDIEKKKEELNSQIVEAKANIATKLQAKLLLDNQVEMIEQQISSYDAIIGQYDLLIAEKQAEIDKILDLSQDKYNTFIERLRSSYEEGTPGVLEIIFNSDSFIDMLTSIERMNDILAYDNRLMEEFDARANTLIAQRKALEGYQAEKQQVEDELLAKKKEIDEKIDESVKYVADLESDVDGFLAYINQLEAEKAKLDGKVESAIDAYNAAIGNNNNTDYKLTKEYKELYVLPGIKNLMESGILQKGVEYYDDGYEYILPIGLDSFANGYLSSDFGWRKYTGKDGNVIVSNHKGIDLAVPYASPIYASKSGTVITAEFSSAYGNVIVVLHDDGTQTRYAHASKMLVSVGEYVLQGEEIAKVGSTGNATGNCCHFEIRLKENNVWDPKNPEKYLVIPKK